MKPIVAKFTIVVHKVHLQVKFPCSLSLQLKIEAEETSIGQEFPLRFGQATIEMGITRDLSLFYDPEKDLVGQKKISVLLFLRSGSGRIPAGVALINVQSLRNGSNSLKLQIEKCPDKQAYIQTTVIYEGPLQKNSQEESPSKKRILTQKHLDEDDELSPIKKAKLTKEITPSHVKKLSTLKDSEQNLKRQYQENSLTLQRTARESKMAHRRLEQNSMDLRSELKKRQLAEKLLKQSQTQLKTLLEKYEDIQIGHESYIKKAQYKLNTLQEQLKYLSDKLSASQSEKQRLIFQKNQLVNRIQQRENTLRQGLRQKERTNSEERVRISKQLQLMTSQFQLFRKGTSQIQQQAAHLQSQLFEHKNKNLEYITENNHLLQEIAELKGQLAYQKEKRQQMQEALESNAQLEEQKKKFRKTIVTLEQEIAQLLKKVSQAEASSFKNGQKNEELQSTLKISKKQNEELLKRLESLQNEVKVHRKKNQELQLSIQKQSQKLANRIKQLQAIQKKSQDEIKESNKKLRQKEDVIKGLNEQLQKDCIEISSIKASNSTLTKELNQLKSQHQNKQNQSQNLVEQLKQLKEELKLLKVELDMTRKQLKEKEAVMTQKQKIQTQLKAQLDQANQKISSLSQLNQKARQQNQKGLKQTSLEVSSLREGISKLQNELKSTKIELQKSKTATLQKEQAISKSKNQLKALQTQLAQVKAQIQTSNKDTKGNETKMKKQVEQLQKQLQSERTEARSQIQELNKSSSELGRLNSDLQQKVLELTKSLQAKQQSTQLHLEYIKPIGQNLTQVRRHLHEYSLVATQFQANKNKLLKVAATKLQQYGDRNVAEKLRDVSLAFQKLKTSTLANLQLSQAQKLSMSEEMKKVQFALDRALRGDR